jgi:hypothetical protein
VEVLTPAMELDGAPEIVAESTIMLEEEGAAEVLFEPVPGEVVFPPLPPLRYGGAGLAVVGSTRAPVPQGMASPSGCFAFGAGTVVPVESVIVKRPVQAGEVGSPGEVNW